MTFRAPTQDILLTLQHMVGFGDLLKHAADLDETMVSAVLEGAGQLATDIIAPLNAVGDEHGATLQNGVVTTAPGFKDAYKALKDGGWLGLSAPTAYGGQGLPKVLEVATMEMVQSANMAFGIGPVLSLGAVEALMHHGTDHQKDTYLPKLISGEWTGTMNLTEPQAGSDVGALTTRAEKQDDGSYLLHGTKIFITWGEHDVADNILHLVLGRLPDAPAGTRGISLFLSPKFMAEDSAGLGDRNDLVATSLEHKLGIHGSPTCVMQYGDTTGAKAELIGQENKGMAHMFTMMNSARVHVGAQGIGIAERAYQHARAYAHDRKQGKAVWSDNNPAAIIHHPDVKRMLAVSRAKILAGRAIIYACAIAADMAKHGDEDNRTTWKAREDLLVPIAKAWGTDLGVEVASIGVQVHGGMGYIEETGAAQHYRDARIAPIYEGTNAIQANDLIGRKLLLDNGKAAKDLIDEARDTFTIAQANDDLKLAAELGLEACDALQQATNWMVKQNGNAHALAGAVSYLTLMGDVAGGMYLMKGAQSAPEHFAAYAKLYSEQVLSHAGGHAISAMMGAETLQSVTL